jgi:hypothetical protein
MFEFETFQEIITDKFNRNFFKFIVDYSVKDNLKTFKEEVLDHLYSLHSLHGEMPVLYSGGMDSTFLIRSLIELGIKPKTITFSFSAENDDPDCEMVNRKCKLYGLEPPEFFYFDKAGFVENVKQVVYEEKRNYPMFHGFLMDYFLKKTKHLKLYTGMGSEFKCFDNKVVMNPGPFVVKKNHPNRLHCFTTDRIFLSYFKNKQFINNYKKPIPILPVGMVDKWYLRDLVYMDCYPDIEREEKFFGSYWRDYVKNPFMDLNLPECVINWAEFDPDFLVNL